MDKIVKADFYLRETLKEILENGYYDDNPRPKFKTGEPAYSKFITHTVETYCINKGECPIPTLRPTAIKSGIKEILWIYQQESNSLKLANEMGIYWWDEFNVGDDTIGIAYGEVCRRYDLVNKLLQNLEQNPFGRRHILNLYQEEESVKQDKLGGLNPCFYSTTWSVRKVGDVRYLDVLLNSRSSDYLVAGFINRTQYTALAQMVAGHLTVVTGIVHKVGKLTVITANAHLYLRHIKSAEEILNRESSGEQGSFWLTCDKLFWEYTIDDWQFNLPKTEKLSEDLEIAI